MADNLSIADIIAIGHLLPEFNPESGDSINSFIDNFEKITQLAKIDDNTKIILIKSKLQGSAKILLENNLTFKRAKTFNEIKEALLNRYEKEVPASLRLKNLSGCIMGEKENFQDFCDRVEKAAYSYLKGVSEGPVNEQLLNKTALNQIFAGAIKSLQEILLLKEPESVQEAIKIGLKQENINKIINGVDELALRNENSEEINAIKLVDRHMEELKKLINGQNENNLNNSLNVERYFNPNRNPSVERPPTVERAYRQRSVRFRSSRSFQERKHYYDYNEGKYFRDNLVSYENQNLKGQNHCENCGHQSYSGENGNRYFNREQSPRRYNIARNAYGFKGRDNSYQNSNRFTSRSDRQNRPSKYNFTEKEQNLNFKGRNKYQTYPKWSE